jgi:hypothetical protein
VRCARARTGDLYRRGAPEPQARTHAKIGSGGDLAGSASGWPMGLAGLMAGPERWAEANWVGPPGSAQLDRKCCFFRNTFLCKDESRNI